MSAQICDYCGGWNTVGCGTCQQRRMRQEPARHTPGPWTVNGRNAGGAIEVAADGYYIADVIGGLVDRQEANAQLIGAAPDLLEIVRISIGNVRSLGPAGAIGPYTEYLVWLEQLEAAYEKATGSRT